MEDAHKNGWAMMDMTLPNVTAKVTTPKHETEVAQRIIALHGVDGTCSNTVLFGAIDFFCTNGMIGVSMIRYAVRIPVASALIGSLVSLTVVTAGLLCTV